MEIEQKKEEKKLLKICPDDPDINFHIYLESDPSTTDKNKNFQKIKRIEFLNQIYLKSKNDIDSASFSFFDTPPLYEHEKKLLNEIVSRIEQDYSYYLTYLDYIKKHSKILSNKNLEATKQSYINAINNSLITLEPNVTKKNKNVEKICIESTNVLFFYKFKDNKKKFEAYISSLKQAIKGPNRFLSVGRTSIIILGGVFGAAILYHGASLSFNAFLYSAIGLFTTNTIFIPAFIGTIVGIFALIFGFGIYAKDMYHFFHNEKLRKHKLIKNFCKELQVMNNNVINEIKHQEQYIQLNKKLDNTTHTNHNQNTKFSMTPQKRRPLENAEIEKLNSTINKRNNPKADKQLNNNDRSRNNLN